MPLSNNLRIHLLGMDFIGQKNAEQLLTAIVLLFAACGFLAGYALQDFSLMVKINGAGLALALLAVLPDWPVYNRNPWTWLDPLQPPSTNKAK